MIMKSKALHPPGSRFGFDELVAAIKRKSTDDALFATRIRTPHVPQMQA